MRLGPDVPLTCDQDHDYSAEQQAADHGAEDMYPKYTGSDLTVSQCLEGFTYKGQPEVPPPGTGNDAAVMSYYDGNTVTALWNYAQHDAMSDNAYGTTYGPSTPGALNVTSAQTYGTTCGPSAAAINVSPCPAPPGLDVSNPANSHITAGPPVAAGRAPPTATPTRPMTSARICRVRTAAMATPRPAPSRWAATTPVTS